MYKKNNFHCMNRICRDYRVFLTVACGKAGYAKVFGKLLYLLSMLAVTLRRPYRLLSSFNLIDRVATGIGVSCIGHRCD